MAPRLLIAGLLTLLALGCGGGSGEEAERELTLGSSAPKAPPPSGDRSTSGRSAPGPRPPTREAAARQPAITHRPIPFDARRMAETAAYSDRHYGRRTARLDPKVIVEHFTVIPTADGVFAHFSEDRPDPELQELPGVCSHFLIDRDGTIFQLVPVRRICRHTVGLNDVAIGVEHVGASDSEVLGNRGQLAASLRLTAWLRCRYRIALKNVIGHAESLSSPYHHERVRRLQRQTHDDFRRAAMQRYRDRLARRRC